MLGELGSKLPLGQLASDPVRSLQVLLENFAATVGAERCILKVAEFLGQPRVYEWTRDVSDGTDEGVLDRLVQILDRETPSDKALLTIPNINDEPSFLGLVSVCDALGVKGIVALPLFSKDSLLGKLFLFRNRLIDADFFKARHQITTFNDWNTKTLSNAYKFIGKRILSDRGDCRDTAIFPVILQGKCNTLGV